LFFFKERVPSRIVVFGSIFEGNLKKIRQARPHSVVACRYPFRRRVIKKETKKTVPTGRVASI
jgi:pentose-5-phosphate-3-epimerase